MVASVANPAARSRRYARIMPTNAATPPGLRAWSLVRSAAATAVRLVRRRVLLVVVVAIAVQGLYVWAVLPLLLRLFQVALDASGVDGLSLAGLPALLTSPLAVLALLVLALVATLFALVEVSVFSVVADLCLRGDAPTAPALLRGLGRMTRRVLGPQVALFAGYALLILPLSHVGVGSTVTSHIAIPQFISGELTKTPVGTVAYVLVVAGIVYLALRLAATVPALAGEQTTVWAAMRRSLALTRRTQVFVALLLLVVGAAAAAVFLAAALLGTIPVALASTAGEGPGASAAGAMLAVLDLVRFVVTGFVAAFLAFFFVALDRGNAASERGGPDPSSETAAVGARVRDRLSRVLAGAVLVVFAVLAVPPTVFATLAAVPADPPLVIAHRGYTALGVENTLSSLRAASDAGADVVEMDIQETADQRFVVIHDTDLQRLAGDPRDVYDLDADELAATVVRQGDLEDRIPTLEEYLREADDLGVRVLVEVKPHGHEAPGFADRVVDALERLDPERRHLVQSLDPALVDRIVAADPERTVVLVTGFQIGDAPRTPADAVAVEDWSYSDEMLVRLRDEGKRLFVWTVDDPALLEEYAGRGVDGVITDRVAEAIAIRDLQQTVTNPVSRYLAIASRRIAVF
ncbi:glycerophosphoryl diester phosphodiesterase membrane domain-containing protein [Microbacterium sp. NPDC090225]|uniref:glycerophosphoryl diester phosphodiesterase membrane domain-containing protein n=1 Tax=Microbacterium sp. NPDC090225 TaxID=3364207 RepID=UPI003806E963